MVASARSLLSGTAEELAPLLRETMEAIGVPVEGMISDGQISIRRAVAQALLGVLHQLCRFRFLRETASPGYEADRHARTPRTRFRRDPDAYLAALEHQACQLTLPAV